MSHNIPIPLNNDVLPLLQGVHRLLVALSESEHLAEESHSFFLERFDELLRNPSERYLGQELLSEFFQRYPQVAHLIPRELLWFYGGDCLHFMPDEEIQQFQMRDVLNHDQREDL